MHKPQQTFDALKIALAAAAGLLVLALAFSALLPETFSRARAAPNHVSEFAPDDQIYTATKKSKKRKRKGRGSLGGNFEGGAGGSYHTNHAPDAAIAREP